MLAFRKRGYTVEKLGEDDLSNHAKLCGLAAVVFLQRPDKITQIEKDITNHVDRLLNYDCRIILRPLPQDRKTVASLLRHRIVTADLPPAAREKAVWQARAAVPPLPFARIYNEHASWDDIGNFLVENPPGPPPNLDLRITIEIELDANGREKKIELKQEIDLLIRRAFHDRAHVHFVPMRGGKSGAAVYRAYPERAAAQVGIPWPLPHFVKIAMRRKIFAEFENYQVGVDPYVPFHLGPHLDRERCCLGARRGILVGDYVEGSESLDVTARSGRAGPAIACLFDRTLHGWYRSATREATSIARKLGNRFPKSIPSLRFKRAKQLGATLTVPQLRALFDLCAGEETLIGPIHGDLHAANVRVRGNDAILIDFLAQAPAPLIYDIACLEASFVVEGFAVEQNDAQENIRKRMESIQSLYDEAPFNISPSHANPKDSCYWFHECVRQLRHYAQRLECHKNQYASALALALVIKSGKDEIATEPEASRRAVAYVLAEKILTNTFAAPVTQTVCGRA